LNSLDQDDPVQVPINGTLDLHGFRPSDVKVLVIEYLNECSKKGIQQGRIIHGKGIGTLREIVHSILKSHPKVNSFALGDSTSGGWGATSFSLNISNK
jgi:dsDNA-specific endonuclease/ATPase MutS2|tara:strand:- start:175 stop:468 length:294 start_codon:yes stop_codon:yes gene_type:complete